MNKFPISIPKECVSNLVISLVTLLVFVCVIFIPGYLKWQRLDRQISDAHYRIEEQKTLLPLYDSLKKTPSVDTASLTVPQKTSLNKAGFESAMTQLRNLSDKASMAVVSIRPDLVNASTSGPHTTAATSVAVNMSLQGSFENFRTVLARIGSLPYVENIENISIQKSSLGKTLDFKIRIIVSIG